jgi:hypothetical protein
MRNNQPKNIVKTCPFLDRACLKTECSIYQENFDRCAIDLLPYNIYRNTEALLGKSDPKR